MIRIPTSRGVQDGIVEAATHLRLGARLQTRRLYQLASKRQAMRTLEALPSVLRGGEAGFAIALWRVTWRPALKLPQ